MPSKDIHTKRMHTYNFIRNFVDKHLRGCKCSQYGSIRSGIDLFESDMDISIEGKPQMSDYQKLAILARALEYFFILYL